MKQPSLKTKRLLLRSFTLADASDVQKLASNKNVSLKTLNIPHPYEPGMAEVWIGLHQANWNNKSRISFAVVDLNSEALIGTVGLVMTGISQADVGYWIGEPYWGKGYCTEAVVELIQFAFNTLSIKTITARHLTSNPGSGRVMQKVGMTHVKTHIQNDRDNNLASLEFYEKQKDSHNERTNDQT